MDLAAVLLLSHDSTLDATPPLSDPQRRHSLQNRARESSTTIATEQPAESPASLGFC